MYEILHFVDFLTDYVQWPIAGMARTTVTEGELKLVTCIILQDNTGSR